MFWTVNSVLCGAFFCLVFIDTSEHNCVLSRYLSGEFVLIDVFCVSRKKLIQVNSLDTHFNVLLGSESNYKKKQQIFNINKNIDVIGVIS